LKVLSAVHRHDALWQKQANKQPSGKKTFVVFSKKQKSDFGEVKWTKAS